MICHQILNYIYVRNYQENLNERSDPADVTVPVQVCVL